MESFKIGEMSTQRREDAEVVENKLSGEITDAAIEVKATEKKHSVYKAQVLTYLRLTNLKLGLVLNFGQERLIDGLFRVVNGL